MELIEKCLLTSVVVCHKSVTLGRTTEHFTSNDGLKVMAYACKIQCVSDNAVRKIQNPCRNFENVGLMMWAVTQDT